MRTLFTRDNLLKSTKELFIVFLGVLLALVGENFVQSANDRALEKEYLEGLLKELETSVRIAVDDRNRLKLLDSSALALIGIIERSKAKNYSCNCNPCELISDLSGVIEPDIYKSVFDDLKSTGNLKVISNGALRRNIIFYYERVLYIEKWCRDIRADLFPFYSKQIIDPLTSEQFFGDSPCDEKRVLKLLAQKEEVIVTLNRARIMASLNWGFVDERINRAEEIMKFIQKELSKK